MGLTLALVLREVRLAHVLHRLGGVLLGLALEVPLVLLLLLVLVAGRGFPRGAALGEAELDLAEEVFGLASGEVVASARAALARLFPGGVLGRQADRLVPSRCLHQVQGVAGRRTDRALLPRLVVVLADGPLRHNDVGSVHLAADDARCLLLLHVPAVLAVHLLPFELVGGRPRHYIDGAMLVLVGVGVVGVLHGVGALDLAQPERAQVAALRRLHVVIPLVISSSSSSIGYLLP